MMIDPAQRQQIAEKAQRALDRHQPRNYRVTVNPNHILEEDGWYTIVVNSEDDRRDRDFYDALAEAEAELQDEQGNQYLLVPVVGD